MKSNKDKILNFILQSEGSEYTNHPRDKGGPTKWGITLQDVRMYINPLATEWDVQQITKQQAYNILSRYYWDALSGDALPSGLDYAVVDYGVLSGINRAGRVLRRALKLPDGDWYVNDGVVGAASKADKVKLVEAINDERLSYLKGLADWKYFGRGWGNRVKLVKERSVEMAKTASFVPVRPPPVPMPEHVELVPTPKINVPLIPLGVGGVLVVIGLGGLLRLRTRKARNVNSVDNTPPPVAPTDTVS